MKRKSDSSIKTLDGSKNSQGIRTRLSTGTLVMFGTSTVSLAEAHVQESASSSNFSSVESDVSKQKADATSPSALKRKSAENKDADESTTEPPKRRKIGRNDGSGEGNRNDYFCWICHKDGVMICCELCPRVFHAKCLSIENVPQDWICPECEKIMQAECTDTRSKTMSLISVGTLCTLLRYALDRMRTVGSDTFERLVDPALFPSYSDYIFHPMSLSVLEKNIKKKTYGCTEAFLADAKWIYHNSMVFNGAQNKITSIARAVLKVCKHEMSEIEVCPDCYYNSCLQTNSDWFCEPCRNPHPLVWAKLKGYPFWPAKALRESNDQVDVRFFGAHDRSWVPVSSCFMLSKVCPVVVKKGRGGMAEAMREVEVHIKKLKEKLGSFEYAPFQTPYSSEAVYSKLKGSSSSGDGSKHAGHGKMGKSKTAEGRLGDKQSVVSKTAMALKSKYNSMSSKKGSQQTGTAVKPGASQSQQVIYLKPMPKGVFLLSEQTSNPEAVQTTSHGTILRRNIPDLQLIKRVSDKILPELMPSSSQSADSKTEKTCDNMEGELSQSKDAVSEMETDAAVNSGNKESIKKGEVTLGETGERSQDVPASSTDVTLSVTDIDSSVTNMPSVTDFLLPMTTVPLSAINKLLHATNVPISSTDLPLSTTDIPLSTKEIPLSTKDNPLPVSNTPAQNSLLPENLKMNTNVSDKQLENSESKIVSLESDEASEEEISEHSEARQNLDNQKQDEAGPKIDSSSAEGMKPPSVVDAVLLNVEAVEVPSEAQCKISSVHNDCAGVDVNREDYNCTSVEVSIPLSISSQSSSNETSNQRPITNNNVTINSNERTSINLHEESESGSATDTIVDTVCNVKTHTKERSEFSDAEQHARIVSPTKDNLAKPANPIEDTVREMAEQHARIVSPTKDNLAKPANPIEDTVREMAEQHARIVSPTKDNLAKPANPIEDTLREMDTSVCASEPAEKEEQSKLIHLCESDGRDSREGTQNVSAASPSPCLSSISIASSSNILSTTTSVATASPGVMYKKSLQKVIDSCKAKLGIDDKNLNNVENDVVVLEGDDEDDSILISDNEFDDDSDVLLMDIDEHSNGPSDPAPADEANCVADKHPADVSVSLNNALPLHPAQGNVEQLDANLRSEILVMDNSTSSDKSISSTLVLDNKKTNTAELETNTSSDKADISTDKSTGISNNLVAGTFKDKDDRLYTANRALATTSFVSVISRNENQTAGSDISTDASRNKTADSNPAVSETISMLCTSEAEAINAVSKEQTSHVRRSAGEAEPKQAAVRHSATASEAVDGASFMSLVDDDEYDSSIDDNVTLDMEVECSDGPEESSDEDTVSDDEVIQMATTSSIDKNSGGKTHISGRNSMQYTLLPPGRIIIGGNQNSRDTSSTCVNYTTLRGALTAPSSSFSILQHSKKCPSPPTSTASTSSDSARGSSGTHLTYTMSKLSQNTEVGAAVQLQQKMVPRILSSKNKRIAPAPAIFTIELNRSSREKQAENPGAGTAVELNGSEAPAGRLIDPARREGSTKHQEDQSAAVSTNHQDDQPAAVNSRIESLVKNRYSMFEKFMMEQLNELALDVTKAAEVSLPQPADDNRQQEAIERLQAEHTRKHDDLKKTMNAALRESLANFKLQKETLAQKLREEFDKELQKAVADTKKQQWCAECWKEAVYYCCWNTSYCSYQCQEKHWRTHMAKCMQTQPQGTTTTSSSSSQSPTIISTLNATVGTNRSNMSMTTPSLPNSILVVTATPGSHPTTTVTPMTAAKAPYKVPSVSIVSPSPWKATDEVNKTKKMYSLVSPQPTSASISTLSIGPPHFQIQYLQQQGTTGPLPQQVQVMGANPSPVPLLVPSMMTSQNQSAVPSPVHLLQNTSMLPLMQRPQAGIPQQAQPIGAARYILPGTFGTLMRPGGAV